MGLKPVVSYGGYEFRMPQELVATWRFDYLLSGSRSFTGTEVFPVPAEAVAASSLRLWFKGEGHGGTIVGVQSTTSPQAPSSGWCPMIYIGLDGRLRAELWNGTTAPITTADVIDDRRWHHVVLVRTARRAAAVCGRGIRRRNRRRQPGEMGDRDATGHWVYGELAGREWFLVSVQRRDPGCGCRAGALGR